jgi:hypothetical protein
MTTSKGRSKKRGNRRTTNKMQKEGKQDRKGKKTQKEADDKMKEQKRGEQNQYTYSLGSGRFRVEDTQPD